MVFHTKYRFSKSHEKRDEKWYCKNCEMWDCKNHEIVHNAIDEIMQMKISEIVQIIRTQNHANCEMRDCSIGEKAKSDNY